MIIYKEIYASSYGAFVIASDYKDICDTGRDTSYKE